MQSTTGYATHSSTAVLGLLWTIVRRIFPDLSRHSDQTNRPVRLPRPLPSPLLQTYEKNVHDTLAGLPELRARRLKDYER